MVRTKDVEMNKAFENGLERAKYSLEEASHSYKQLCASADKNTEKSHWKNFSIEVDSVRQALVEVFIDNKKLHSAWYSTFKHDFENDPLLNYMRNARNNLGHAVTKLPINNNSVFSLKDKNGLEFSIDEVSQTLEDGRLVINFESKNLPDNFIPDCDIFLDRAFAEPVLNNNKWYEVPTTHKDCLLSSSKLTLFAAVTLDYYSQILVKASSQT